MGNSNRDCSFLKLTEIQNGICISVRRRAISCLEQFVKRKMMGINSEGMLISAVHEEDGHECLNLLMVDDKIPAGAKLY